MSSSPKSLVEDKERTAEDQSAGGIMKHTSNEAGQDDATDAATLARQEAAAVHLQRLYRGVRARKHAVDVVMQVYEKGYSSEYKCFYYFNVRTQESSWFKPKLLGEEQDLPLTPRSKAQAEADENVDEAAADRSSAAAHVDLSTSEHAPQMRAFRSSFDLDAFLGEHGLGRLAENLREEGFADPEALALAQEGDLELLGLRRGEQRVLQRAIVGLRARMREAGIPVRGEGSLDGHGEGGSSSKAHGASRHSPGNSPGNNSSSSRVGYDLSEGLGATSPSSPGSGTGYGGFPGAPAAAVGPRPGTGLLGMSSPGGRGRSAGGGGYVAGSRGQSAGSKVRFGGASDEEGDEYDPRGGVSRRQQGAGLGASRGGSRGSLRTPLGPQSRRARAAEAQRLRAETLDRATRLGVTIPDEVREALTMAGSGSGLDSASAGGARAVTPMERGVAQGTAGGVTLGQAGASAARDAAFAKEVVLETLHPGDDADQAQDGDIVRCHYDAYLPDGSLFESSKQRGRAFQFRLGAGQVLRGFEMAIKRMGRGSRARFVVPSELAYGRAGRLPKVPPDTPLEFDVQLIDFYEPELQLTPRDDGGE